MGSGDVVVCLGWDCVGSDVVELDDYDVAECVGSDVVEVVGFGVCSGVSECVGEVGKSCGGVRMVCDGTG